MTGTLVCGVCDTPAARGAAQLAVALSQRLGLRLVLAHAVDGVPSGAHESVTSRQRHAGGERLLEAVAEETGAPDGTELRIGFGERAEFLAQIAAEEGADAIVVGSRGRGFRGRQLGCGLARELEAATPAPVLIAPPQTRKRSRRRLAALEASAAR
jgi:nucleotide-binding universal stress UspA family protein